jgi:hypothetical protein
MKKIEVSEKTIDDLKSIENKCLLHSSGRVVLLKNLKYHSEIKKGFWGKEKTIWIVDNFDIVVKVNENNTVDVALNHNDYAFYLELDGANVFLDMRKRMEFMTKTLYQIGFEISVKKK